MSTSWHYMKNGAQTGPVTTEELKAFVASGAIKADTLVWREGLISWGPANVQSEFSGIVPPPPPAAPAAGGVSGGPGVFTPAADDVEKNKIFGVLCYLPPFLFLVALLAARESKFAMYHCNQGLVLTLAAFGIGIANMIICMMLAFIPFLGWLLAMLMYLGVIIVVVGLVIMGIINAANGVCKPLPLIGNLFTLVK
jgi:uncharacterized membrane protein